MLAIINDVIVPLRPESYSIEFLFVAIFVEIVRLTALTEKANRERMLRVQNSMRLAQIGEMTATVAHELVNPLAIILGNTDIALKTEPVDPARMRKIIEKIQESATRMLGIVRGLRDHARQVETESERIDIGKTLSEVCDMIRPMHSRDGILLELDLAADLPCIIGNKGKLQQILLNLLQNASDATEGKHPRKISLTAHCQDGRLQISVKDNGSGIPQENLSKIFTPFFTTKPRGKGTGIGLSFVDSQVRLMNGTVRVESEPGNTVFTLLFPTERS
jgi:two-component system NtrC family sensor kinase